jgi:hypothetical protein
MSKNAWLKVSIDQHRINYPASAGYFCSLLLPLFSPAFMTFFRESPSFVQMATYCAGATAGTALSPWDRENWNRPKVISKQASFGR